MFPFNPPENVTTPGGQKETTGRKELMYNELFYLRKKCFILRIFRLLFFGESTNFKICDFIIDNATNKLHFRLFL